MRGREDEGGRIKGWEDEREGGVRVGGKSEGGRSEGGRSEGEE